MSAAIPVFVCDSDEESDEDDNLELNALEKRAKTAATQQQNGEVDEEDRKDLLPVRTKQGWVQRYLFLGQFDSHKRRLNCISMKSYKKYGNLPVSKLLNFPS